MHALFYFSSFFLTLCLAVWRLVGEGGQGRSMSTPRKRGVGPRLACNRYIRCYILYTYRYIYIYIIYTLQVYIYIRIPVSIYRWYRHHRHNILSYLYGISAVSAILVPGRHYTTAAAVVVVATGKLVFVRSPVFLFSLRRASAPRCLAFESFPFVSDARSPFRCCFRSFTLS